MTTRSVWSCLLFAVLGIASAAAFTDTLNYQYDALGRLEAVEYGNGSVVSYTLDAAGNRTEVATRTPPGVPSSITVPASSTTGNYTVSWGTASGTVTAYELYESTSSNFTSETLAHSGAATSKAISGKGNGTYYYRVRACNGSACFAAAVVDAAGVIIDAAAAVAPGVPGVVGLGIRAGRQGGNAVKGAKATKNADSRRKAEQQARRAERRERESRESPEGARDQAGNPQKPSGEGFRDHESASKGPSGERPAGPDRSDNRERNVGIDEEHSRRPKGGFR